MALINATDVINEFGKKYVPGGQTEKDIKLQLFAQSETEKLFNKIPVEGDVYRSSFAKVDEVTQAFSIPFKPKGTLAFKPTEIVLGEFKIDDLMTPDTFRNSWLGFLAKLEEVDRSKWPILQYYINNILLPKIQEEMEEEIAFYGWKKTGESATPVVDETTLVREFTADAVTPANAAMNGIRLEIIRNINRVNVINAGAWSADPVTFVGQVEAFVAEIDPKLRKKIDLLNFSEDLVNRFTDGVREKYNKYYAQRSDLLIIEKSNIKMNPLHSMAGSQKCWGTPAINRVMPVKKENSGRFDIQKADRSVKSLTDWKKGLGFDVPEFVVTNDLENSITLAEKTERYS
jgi:hypothetical protein